MDARDAVARTRWLGGGVMQFPMNRTDRLALTAIADDLAALERRAADLGLDFLALIVSQAREEACEHLQDDIQARTEFRNPIDFASIARSAAPRPDE